MEIKEQLKNFVDFCESKFYNKIDEMSQKEFEQVLDGMTKEERDSYRILAECYPKHNKFILVKKFILNRYDFGDLQIDMKFIKEESFKKVSEQGQGQQDKRKQRQEVLKKVENRYKEMKQKDDVK